MSSASTRKKTAVQDTYQDAHGPFLQCCKYPLKLIHLRSSLTLFNSQTYSNQYIVNALSHLNDLFKSTFPLVYNNYTIITTDDISK